MLMQDLDLRIVGQMPVSGTGDFQHGLEIVAPGLRHHALYRLEIGQAQLLDHGIERIPVDTPHLLFEGQAQATDFCALFHVHTVMRYR